MELTIIRLLLLWPRMESIRLMLALATGLKMKIQQFDVVTAYLNGNLEKNVFMEIPEMLPEMLERITEDSQVSQEVKRRAKKMLNDLERGKSVCRLQKATASRSTVA